MHNECFFHACTGLYYGVSICLVSFASGLSVVTLNLHHRGLRGTEVPYILRKIILGGLARLVLLRFDVERRSPTPAAAATEPASADATTASRLGSRSSESPPPPRCGGGMTTTDLRCTCDNKQQPGRHIHQQLRGRQQQPNVGVSATRSSAW